MSLLVACCGVGVSFTGSQLCEAFQARSADNRIFNGEGVSIVNVETIWLLLPVQCRA